MATKKQIQAAHTANEQVYYSVNSRHYELVTIVEVGNELTKFQSASGKIESCLHKYIKLNDDNKSVKKDSKRTFLSVAKW